MIGPGKYDDLCTWVFDQAQAKATIVIVFGGAKGSGFSVHADLETVLSLPDILEGLAEAMRADLTSQGKPS